jgi:RNase P subunit RPR2
MFMLRFFCPTAREEFDSGIILDERTYQRNRLSIVSVNCMHCQRQHRFLMADARFTAEEVAA